MKPMHARTHERTYVRTSREQEEPLRGSTADGTQHRWPSYDDPPRRARAPNVCAYLPHARAPSGVPRRHDDGGRGRQARILWVANRGECWSCQASPPARLSRRLSIVSERTPDGGLPGMPITWACGDDTSIGGARLVQPSPRFSLCLPLPLRPPPAVSCLAAVLLFSSGAAALSLIH